MEENTSKKHMNKWIKLTIAFFIVLLFQFLYQISCNHLIILIARIIPGLSNNVYLMIHHSIMFILVFIPTLILYLKKKIDFGYHKGFIKPFLICLSIISAYEIIVTTIQAICGSVSDFEIDTIIFQLFFSGLGEEILYRSIPLVIFVYAFGNETSIKIKDKYNFDFGIILSAILFAIAHISISFNPFSISAYWLQLINCIVVGIVIGYCYKYSKSIWLCMLLHGIINIIIVGIPMIASLF